MNKNYYFDTNNNKKTSKSYIKNNFSKRSSLLETDYMENELYSEIIKNIEKIPDK